MEKLSGKTALVTGSSRGIGRAVAVGLAREGALVAVHYAHNEQAAQETVELIEKDSGRAFTVGAELGVPGDIDRLFRCLEAGLKEQTGTTTLDILVNNAGETLPGGAAPEEVSGEQFDTLFAVNAKAPFFEEVADAVVFLATDQARWITGTFVDATGGSLLGQTSTS
ncbi:SDR family NAD(P)-dependent oxidoreductase [Nonomuraea angiospora]|uniref:SDR family NAD(P)-dependent oxidoreductase n=1 Tax=Nonomuraea angiospora TaxID=46172 RepID=UPI00332DE27D